MEHKLALACHLQRNRFSSPIDSARIPAGRIEGSKTMRKRKLELGGNEVDDERQLLDSLGTSEEVQPDKRVTHEQTANCGPEIRRQN